MVNLSKALFESPNGALIKLSVAKHGWEARYVSPVGASTRMLNEDAWSAAQLLDGAIKPVGSAVSNLG